MKTKYLAVIIALALVSGSAISANASNLRWEDRVEDDVTTSPSGTFWGFDLPGLDRADLREYRPVGFIDDNLYPKSGGMFFLGGQEVFSTQSSWAQTLPSVERDEFGDFVLDENSNLIGDPNSISCDWFTGLASECLNSLQEIEFSANLPVCDDSVAQDSQPCVVSLSENGNGLSYHRDVDSSLGQFWETGIIVEEGIDGDRTLEDFIEEPTWTADSELGVPAGGSSSLWVRGVAPENSDAESGIFVRATLKGGIYWDNGTPQVYFRGLDAQVVNYRLLSVEVTDQPFSSLFYPPARVTLGVSEQEFQFNSTFPFFGSSPMVSYNSPTDKQFGGCAFEELIEDETPIVSNCGVALALDPSNRYELKLRIPEAIGGWFHGRLASANMTLEPSLAADFGDFPLSELTVSGGAVDVPTTGVQYEVCDGSESVYEQYAPGDCDPANGSILVGLGQWSPSSPTAIEDFMVFEPLMVSGGSTQAKGSVNLWSFGTMENPGNQLDLSGCPAGVDQGLQGMIATNSMVYQAGLPLSQAGSLNYQVASTEFDRSGQLAIGDYTLVMRSDLARCIYNLGDTPITSSNTEIVVTGDEGGTRNATTSFEDFDGWLTFKATGFGFSAPTISVAINKPTSSPGFVPRTIKKPIVLAAPKINKSPKVGKRIQVSEGSWQSETNPVYTYQWYRCSEGFAATSKLSSKAGCKPISGATASSYSPTKKDSKFLLSAKVTATNSGGSSSVFTAAAPFGVKKLLSYTISPGAIGSAKVKEEVAAMLGVWNMKTTNLKVSWLRCDGASAASELGRPANCEATGITKRKYAIKRADLGKHLVARITATKGKQVFVHYTASLGPVVR